MKQKNRFGEFIANLRKEKLISQEQLCDGLCDLSMLSRFERGVRDPEKLLQNRFLTRLGAVPENYENFLYYKDYCRWEKRQGILHNILEENIAEAKRLLEEYRKEFDMTCSLEQQFYLAILAQIRRYERCEKEELATIFHQALELTVPQLETMGITNRALSLEEINLYLEYVYCSGGALLRYEEILDYMEKIERTVLAMAKVYPKAVYYYYSAWEKSEEKEAPMVVRMLELCDKAIEILRDANRMFYLWELFCMREGLLPLLPEEIRERDEMQKRQMECRGWRETLEEIYRDYGVTIGMYEFCYLYVESENYCIGDVIRIRRTMLGISQKKLCVGICDERTVSRLERNIGKPQREVVQRLFDRLNLSTELNRTELVTDSQEAIKLYDEIGRQNNNLNYERVELLLEKLKQMVSMQIPSNIQAITRNEVLNQYNGGRINKDEYVEKMKQALEYTVPYLAAVGEGQKYLTLEEISCLQNITLEIDWSFKEMQECIETLVEICEKPKYPVNYVRLYEFIMAAVSSYLGDEGEFDRSNQIKHNIICMSLKYRRIKAINNALYGVLWNEEQKSKNTQVSSSINLFVELEKCIQMSSLSKNEYRKKVYEDKLMKEKEKIKQPGKE